MENPVFKLEKVVRSKAEEEMQDFEGPLDLILYLLGKNKMEIQDISISLICDQYMAWLSRRQELDLEVASEFVTMASQLVYIKTRMLLSIEDEEAQSEMDALIASLNRHFSVLITKMKVMGEDASYSPQTETYNYNDRTDEIGVLHQQFDLMAAKIQNLIRINYVNELLKKEARLKALENQILNLQATAEALNVGPTADIAPMVANTTFAVLVP